MKINEFIETYKKNSKQPGFNVAKLINAKTYVPVLRKKQLAELVYDTCTSIENGIVKVNSLSKYLMFTMLMINEYTDLEFAVNVEESTGIDSIEEYDMLCEEGLVDVILSCFATDYARSNEILNYVFMDNLAVTNTVESIVGNVAQKVNNSLDTITDSLKNKIDEFDMNMADLDMSQIENIMNLLGSVAK